MNRELAVTTLKDMLGDYKDNNFSKDKEALEYAIKEIEKSDQEKNNDVLISYLSWRGANNYRSALRYEKETETILIDEDRLMRLIQIITPRQKKRNIKVVKGLIE